MTLTGLTLIDFWDFIVNSSYHIPSVLGRLPYSVFQVKINLPMKLSWQASWSQVMTHVNIPFPALNALLLFILTLMYSVSAQGGSVPWTMHSILYLVVTLLIQVCPIALVALLCAFMFPLSFKTGSSFWRAWMDFNLFALYQKLSTCLELITAIFQWWLESRS